MMPFSIVVIVIYVKGVNWRQEMQLRVDWKSIIRIFSHCATATIILSFLLAECTVGKGLFDVVRRLHCPFFIACKSLV